MFFDRDILEKLKMRNSFPEVVNWEEYHPKIKLRYSMRNLIRQEGLLNIPLFLSDRTRFFLDQELD